MNLRVKIDKCYTFYALNTLYKKNKPILRVDYFAEIFPTSEFNTGDILGAQKTQLVDLKN